MIHRLARFFSRISIRLLAFNVLLVFLPAAGILSLETYERQLLDRQERSMVQQGRLLAAALGEQGRVTPEAAEGILINMERAFDARLRVIDTDFTLLADSSRLGPSLDGDATSMISESTETAETAETRSPEAVTAEPEIRDSLLYRFGNFLYQTYTRFALPPEPPRRDAGFYATGRKLVGPEIEDALSGRYGAAVRTTGGGQRSLTLFSALPIVSGGEVVGAVLVSKSTFQILGAIYELRLQMFRVILASVAAAVVLSLLLSTTIARPIQKLRRRANEMLDRRGRLRDTFEPYQRLDEIGDLSRALAELTRRLEGHLHFIESFASDVSHELKNPLASIRTASELLGEVDEPEDRERFLGMIRRDVARLEHLISGVREVSKIDATLDAQPVETVDLRPLVASVLEGRRLRHEETLLRFDAPGPKAPDVEAPIVRGAPDRLAQVIENLVDNAVGFTPSGEAVEVEMVREGDEVVLRVLDRGPGIPEEHREKIFHRFFTYRDEGKAGHTGLGLSIVKAIVEGYGGTLAAHARDGGGTVFEVRLPSAA